MSDETSRMDAREVEDRILAFVRRELLGSEVTVERDDELLSGDRLDSVGALRLAAFVEREYDLKMLPTDFVVANFRTVVALAQYVLAAVGRDSASRPDIQR